MNIGNIVTIDPNPYAGHKALGLKVNPDRPFVSYGQTVFNVYLGEKMVVLDRREKAWNHGLYREGTMVKLMTESGRTGWCFTDHLVVI